MTRDRQRGAILFDLDGTLVDTAPDMGAAINAVLKHERLEPLAPEAIRPVVSHGTGGLVRLAFGDSLDAERFAALSQAFLDAYTQRFCCDSSVFAGLDAVLAQLERHDIAWGVVTNKPMRFTDPLLRWLGLHRRAACVVSGDSLPQRKPHPEPLLHAARHMGLAPESCVYVGDARRDIEAGNAANMVTLAATYGYIEAHDDPHDWGAGFCVASTAELCDWVDAWLQNA